MPNPRVALPPGIYKIILHETPPGSGGLQSDTCIHRASGTRVPNEPGLHMPNEPGICVPNASRIHTPHASGLHTTKGSSIRIPIAPDIHTPLSRHVWGNQLGSHPNERVLTSPRAKEDKLYLDQYKGEAEQLWQIGGDGTITALCSPYAKLCCENFSVDQAEVTESFSNISYNWIICAWQYPDDTFAGYIMTNDTMVNFLGVLGDEIRITRNGLMWKFEPLLRFGM